MPDNQPAPAIFINYRREKTRDKALILRVILEAHFGPGSVFLDEETVTLGTVWPDALRSGVENAEVLLSLIHDKWHADTNEAGNNRLKLATDYLLPGTTELVRVEGGIFMMGAEDGSEDERPVHPVTLNAFQLAATPVTFRQYALYCFATDREKELIGKKAP